MKIEFLKKIPPERIIHFEGDINDNIAKRVNSKLLKCDSESNQPILFLINSPGGLVTPAFAIVGVMKLVHSPIVTFASGEASSGAALILMSGDKGLRFAEINSNILIHYISPRVFVDSELAESNLKKANKRLEKFICSATKQKLAIVKKHMKNEYYFTPEEALGFGIIDHVC